MATQQFDFNEYNKVMENANSGLKLYLAEQLLGDALATMLRYKSPLFQELMDARDEITDIRAKAKKLAESRERSNGTTA
jgi:predicted component of type VI protein secretion system